MFLYSDEELMSIANLLGYCASNVVHIKLTELLIVDSDPVNNPRNMPFEFFVGPTEQEEFLQLSSPTISQSDYRTWWSIAESGFAIIIDYSNNDLVVVEIDITLDELRKWYITWGPVESVQRTN